MQTLHEYERRVGAVGGRQVRVGQLRTQRHTRTVARRSGRPCGTDERPVHAAARHLAAGSRRLLPTERRARYWFMFIVVVRVSANKQSTVYNYSTISFCGCSFLHLAI